MTRILSWTCIYLFLVSFPGSTLAEDITIRVKVVGTQNSGQVSVLSDDSKSSWNMQPEDGTGWSSVTIKGENLQSPMNTLEIVLENKETGERTERFTVRFPVLYQNRETRFYINLERPEIKTSTIKNLNNIATQGNDPFALYFKARWLHSQSQKPLNYDLAVASAYLWFKGSYQLATSKYNYDAIPIDYEAIEYLLHYLSFVEDSNSGNHDKWARAWRNFFGSTKNITIIKDELQKAEHTEWNMYQYIRFYNKEAKYAPACNLLNYFTQKLIKLDNNARIYVVKTYFNGEPFLRAQIDKDNSFLQKKLGTSESCIVPEYTAKGSQRSLDGVELAERNPSYSLPFRGNSQR